MHYFFFTTKNYNIFFIYSIKKQSPENVAPLLVKLTFFWMDRLIKTGFRRNLNPNDIWEIDSSESSEFISGKLEAEWNKKADM